MSASKPQLAEDFDPKKLQWPMLMQPKIDGVRGINLFGTMTARSLRPHSNKASTLFFSQAQFLGIDGELAADRATHPLLCSRTTSALNTIGGSPWIMWHAFDYLHPRVSHLLYKDRLAALKHHIHEVQSKCPELGAHLELIESNMVTCDEEFNAFLAEYAELGYEGGILRDPYGKHKNGRSSPTHRGLLRCKTFMAVECVVTRLLEGQSNQNEAKTNRLGNTERSTHAAGMVPNGMVGTVVATLCEDARHPLTGKLVHEKGETIEFGAGKLTHAERDLYFKQPGLILGKRMIGQIFPHGVKDKARFPTFHSLRADADSVLK